MSFLWLKLSFEFEGENWDVYVCNMINGGIDDTKGNANSKHNDGKWKIHFISSYFSFSRKRLKVYINMIGLISR